MVMKQLAFLIGLLSPLGQGMVAHIANRAMSTVGKTLRQFVSKAKSRDFDVVDIRADGEKCSDNDPRLQRHGDRGGSFRAWPARP
jgi:hypothetical protein